MSGVHINLIVGNHDNSQDEDKNELVEERMPLPNKIVDRPEDILEIKVELPENLAEDVAEKIKKEKAGILA